MSGITDLTFKYIQDKGVEYDNRIQLDRDNVSDAKGNRVGGKLLLGMVLMILTGVFCHKARVLDSFTSETHSVEEEEEKRERLKKKNVFLIVGSTFAGIAGIIVIYLIVSKVRSNYKLEYSDMLYQDNQYLIGQGRILNDIIKRNNAQ